MLGAVDAETVHHKTDLHLSESDSKFVKSQKFKSFAIQPQYKFGRLGLLCSLVSQGMGNILASLNIFLTMKFGLLVFLIITGYIIGSHFCLVTCRSLDLIGAAVTKTVSLQWLWSLNSQQVIPDTAFSHGVETLAASAIQDTIIPDATPMGYMDVLAVMLGRPNIQKAMMAMSPTGIFLTACYKLLK